MLRASLTRHSGKGRGTWHPSTHSAVPRDRRDTIGMVCERVNVDKSDEACHRVGRGDRCWGRGWVRFGVVHDDAFELLLRC
jgi:hypothetical protein